MNTATPRTDAGCAPIFFSNGTSTIAADPDISRQLERELAEANRKLEWLKSKAYRESAQWGFCAAQWSIHFCRKDEDADLSQDFFEALKQCMDDRANPTNT